MIQLDNLCKTYGKDNNKIYAINHLSLEIPSGAMVSISGPSGSGKSTLLNILSGLIVPDSGSYFYNGKCVNNFSEKEKAIFRNYEIGYITQNFNLLDEYTIYENIRLPLLYSKKNKKNARTLILSYMKKLNIDKKENSYPSGLSGGEKQRTAIIRALINDPNIILADEPTGSLDTKTGTQVINILREINRHGKTVIIVTHDQRVADCCDKRYILTDGEIN